MTDEQVPGMAEAVASRMLVEGIGPGDLLRLSGLSDTQCLEVRGGRRKAYAHKTLRGIAVALRWPLDWYDQLLSGVPGTALPDVDWPRERTTEERVEALEAGLAGLRADLQRLLDAVDPPSP